MAIDVTNSKTDQLRKGSEVVIANGSSVDTCRVNILRRYFTEVERYPIDSSHYIFRPLSKCRAGHSLFLLISQLVTLAFVIILSVVSRYCPRCFSVWHSFLKGWWCFGCGQCRRAR